MAKEKNPTYQKLLEIRKSKTLKLAPNQYLKPELVLRYYQIQAIAHLYMTKRMILGEDCGLGKTIEVIATYAGLLAKDPTYKLLVICPNSALYQWQAEINKFSVGIASQIVESGDLKINDEQGKRTLKSFNVIKSW